MASRLPRWLLRWLFLGDCDGESGLIFLQMLVQWAGNGLRRIFSHCEGFPPNGRSAAVDEGSRSVTGGNVRKLDRTHRGARCGKKTSCVMCWRSIWTSIRLRWRSKAPRGIWEELIAFVREEVEARRLNLTPAPADAAGLAAAQLDSWRRGADRVVAAYARTHPLSSGILTINYAAARKKGSGDLTKTGSRAVRSAWPISRITT